MPPAPPLVIVALGSNLGDSGTTIRTAIERLRSRSPDSFRASSLWVSAPVDCPPGSPDFINAVVAFRSAAEATPEALLAQLQEWERDFGRVPKQVLNEPRPLDLDLIAYGDERRQTPALTLPHPRAHLRRFVLEPLVEIAPDLVLAGHDRTVRSWLEQLPPAPGLRRHIPADGRRP